MLHHKYQTTVEAGINELYINIKYSYIDEEIEIEIIRLSLVETSKLDNIYIDGFFFDRYKEKYLDDLVENACADIEDKKQYENNQHDEAKISAFEIRNEG